MKKSIFPYLVLTPMLVLLATFLVAPIIGSFVIAFFDYNPLRAGVGDMFVGIKNFQSMLTNSVFLIAFRNTLYYVFVMVGINLVLTLAIAQLLVTLHSNKWRSLFRVNFFMPCVAPLAAVAVVWSRSILATKGAVNMFLDMFGATAVNWVGNPATLMPAIIVLSLWADIGYNIVLFIAGMQGIPDDYLEAAQIDGANPFQKFIHITMPLLGRTLAFVVTMTFISQFQAFAQFHIVANQAGGVSYAGYVLSAYIYDAGFKVKDMGYASAVSIVLFFLIMTVTLVQKRFNRVDWGY